MEGLVLSKALTRKNVLLDYRVVQFLTKYQYKKSINQLSVAEKAKQIQQAIATKKHISLVYLKPSDEKSRRDIIPSYVGELRYNDTVYQGVRGHCLIRNAERVFRLDRILDIHLKDTPTDRDSVFDQSALS